MKDQASLNEFCIFSTQMWLFGNRKSEVRSALADVLKRTKSLIDASEESCWAGLSPAEIGMDLSIAIESLTKGESIDRDLLRIYFAPTGPLQETAMMSSWTDEYLSLSEQFDGLIVALK